MSSTELITEGSVSDRAKLAAAIDCEIEAKAQRRIVDSLNKKSLRLEKKAMRLRQEAFGQTTIDDFLEGK